MKSLNIKEIKTTKEVITAAKELAESTVKGLKVRQIKLEQSIGFAKEERDRLECLLSQLRKDVPRLRRILTTHETRTKLPTGFKEIDIV